MKDKEIKEGLGDLAHLAEKDHEVQMARAELYKVAKYAIKLHEMLKGVSEADGLEGWVQAKITKSADYISSVYHHLDYDLKFGEQVTEAKKGYCSDDCCGSDVKAEDCTCPPTCKHCDCNSVTERKMTKGEKSKETKLKKKYDDSDMKKNMKKQYGKDGESVYYATIRKKAMESNDPYKAEIAKRLNSKLSTIITKE